MKVLSFTKEEGVQTKQANEEIEKIDNKIAEIKKDKETLKVLLEQKKIAEEIRIKIEEENQLLKSKLITLQNQISLAQKVIQEHEVEKKEIKFLELNLLYGSKCKKTFYNKLYEVGTPEYRNCVFRKGKVKKD